MDRQDYAVQLLEHYESPRHYGNLPEADVVAGGENPGCGDVVTIYLKVGQGNVAQKVTFEGDGCTISLGATSVLLDMVQGKTLAEIEAIDYNHLIDTLGKDVVLTRVKCATLGLKMLKEAVAQYAAQHPQPAA